MPEIIVRSMVPDGSTCCGKGAVLCQYFYTPDQSTPGYSRCNQFNQPLDNMKKLEICRTSEAEK